MNESASVMWSKIMCSCYFAELSKCNEELSGKSITITDLLLSNEQLSKVKLDLERKAQDLEDLQVGWEERRREMEEEIQRHEQQLQVRKTAEFILI